MTGLSKCGRHAELGSASMNTSLAQEGRKMDPVCEAGGTPTKFRVTESGTFSMTGEYALSPILPW